MTQDEWNLLPIVAGDWDWQWQCCHAQCQGHSGGVGRVVPRPMNFMVPMSSVGYTTWPPRLTGLQQVIEDLSCIYIIYIYTQYAVITSGETATLYDIFSKIHTMVGLITPLQWPWYQTWLENPCTSSLCFPLKYKKMKPFIQFNLVPEFSYSLIQFPWIFPLKPCSSRIFPRMPKSKACHSATVPLKCRAGNVENFPKNSRTLLRLSSSWARCGRALSERSKANGRRWLVLGKVQFDGIYCC